MEKAVVGIEEEPRPAIRRTTMNTRPPLAPAPRTLPLSTNLLPTRMDQPIASARTHKEYPMNTRITGLMVAIVLVIGLIVPSRARAQSFELCFDAPGITNCIRGRFLQYWRDNG